jgi:hypothetical protein
MSFQLSSAFTHPKDSPGAQLLYYSTSCEVFINFTRNGGTENLKPHTQQSFFKITINTGKKLHQ